MAGIVGDIFTGVINGLADLAGKATSIRTAITGKDPEVAAQIDLLAQQIQMVKAQAQAASESAQNQYDMATLGVTGTNFFKFWVAGPKPALFWVCVIAFFLQYAVVPIGTWFGLTLKPIDLNLPSQVALALAGVGSLIARVVEKSNGSAGNH